MANSEDPDHVNGNESCIWSGSTLFDQVSLSQLELLPYIYGRHGRQTYKILTHKLFNALLALLTK